MERKSKGDSKDWLNTVVAFANTVPSDRCGVLYIGVRDDGSVEGADNWDSIQRKLEQKLSRAYPRINYWTRVLPEEDRSFLCVVVPGGSAGRPHFAGASYVRVGSQTCEASAGQLDQLVAQRNSKAARILEAKDKTIRAEVTSQDSPERRSSRAKSGPMTVVHCTPFTLHLRDPFAVVHQFPLERVTITEEHPHFRSNIALRIED